ncbi:MAG: cold shock domain-containing protein [Pseudomonadota bacterium]
MPDKKAGSVKWFDSTKGFGFITDDDGGRDILLHANVLRNMGHSSVIEGTRLEVMVTETPRGLQAAEIVTMDLPQTDVREAFKSSPESGFNLDEIVSTEPLTPARVKWFDKVKGFGFVNLFGSAEDIFVHMEVLRAYGIAELVQGEAICVRTAQGPRGRMAVEVRAWDFASSS